MTDLGALRRRADLPAPAGLSEWAQSTWATLLADNAFAEFELVTFTRALRWWDVSDRLLAEAEALSGRDFDRELKSAADAATTALRFWRSLKFTSGAPARRPGRPTKASYAHPA